MKREFMDTYKSRSNGGQRGFPAEWRGAFHGRMGIDAAREETRGITPESILGLSSNPSWVDVVKAHRTLAKQYHPDMATGDAVKFRKIQAAFELLEFRFGKN